MECSVKTALISILTNVLLVGIKTTVAWFSGSLAVAADAIHSLSDVVSSVIILIGIKISQRPARGFPYGLYKVENLVAMVTSVLILFAGYEILKAVFIGTSQPLPSQIPLAVAGISITILITWLFSRYELKMGQKTGSPSLVADAQHIRSDMLSSLIILVGLLGSSVGVAADKYAAVIVVIFIARSALVILVNSIRVLLDASLDHTSLTRIREIVLTDPRVYEINELRARNAGRYKFVELDVTLQVKELARGHQLAEEIENRIKTEIANIDRVLIHYQPKQHNILTIGLPLAEDEQTLSDHFGEAPFFQLFDFQRKDGKISNEQILKNPYLHEKKAKGIKVANWLLEKGLEMLIVRNDQTGKGPGYVLGNAGAGILLTKETNAAKAFAIVEENIGGPGLDKGELSKIKKRNISRLPDKTHNDT